MNQLDLSIDICTLAVNSALFVPGVRSAEWETVRNVGKTD